MRLYFAKADLLLHKNEKGEYCLEQCGQVLEIFKSERQAVAKYKRIRADLETEMPPTEITEHERRTLLEKYLADNRVQHNSLRAEPQRKPAKSRTFG
jgi:hypothetical protein